VHSFIFMNFVCHLHNLKGKCFWFTQNGDVKSNTNTTIYFIMFSSFTLFALLTVKSSIQVNRKTNVLTLNSKWKKTVIGKCQKSIKRTLPSQRCQRIRGQKSVPLSLPLSQFLRFSPREKHVFQLSFLFLGLPVRDG